MDEPRKARKVTKGNFSVIPHFVPFVYFVVYISFVVTGVCKMPELLYREECFQIQGAIFDVYKEMGPGFLESVYQECLERELAARAIPFQQQCEIRLNYKGAALQQYFKADLICYDLIIVELKACKSLEPIHRAQIMNYLRATGKRLGLLVNFNAYPKVDIERIIV